MLLTFILYICGFILSMIYGIFSTVEFTLNTTKISTAITYFVSHLVYLGSFFPIADFMQALGMIISFMTGMYIIRLILMLFHMLPWFGKKVDLPKSSWHNQHNNHR